MSVTAAYRNCVMHINITWTQNESGILSETRTGTQAKYTRSYNIKCHICIRMALSWFASHSHMTFKHSPNHIEQWFGSNLIAPIAFYLPFKSDQFKHIVIETFLWISLFFFRHSSRCRMPIAEFIQQFRSPNSETTWVCLLQNHFINSNCKYSTSNKFGVHVWCTKQKQLQIQAFERCGLCAICINTKHKQTSGYNFPSWVAHWVCVCVCTVQWHTESMLSNRSNTKQQHHSMC